MVRSLAAYICILIWAAVLYIPFWTGHVGIEGDGHFHHRAVIQIAEAQSEGMLYPQWLPDQRSGLGDPSFVYYPPLFHTVAALVDHAVGNAWTAMRTVMMLSTAFAGAIAFLYLRTLFPEHLALLGALAIEANPLPIHQMAKGGVYPANIVYPLVLLCFILLTRIQRDRWISPGLALSAFLLTLAHALTCFMLCIAIPCGIAVHSIARREAVAVLLRRLLQSGFSLGLGICLSAFYLIPAVTTMRYISPNQWVLSGPCTMDRSFLLPFFTYTLGMCWKSVQIGFPAAAALALIGTAVYLKRLEKSTVSYSAGAFVCIGIVALFFGSDFSYPLWQVHSPLQTLQFPDRFNTVLLSAALLGLALTALHAWTRQPKSKLCLALAGLLALPALFSGALVADLLRLPVRTDISNEVDATGDIGRPEYLPVTAKPAYREYLHDGSFAGECRRLAISCGTLQRNSREYDFRIDAKQPVAVRLPVFGYPAWITIVDGNRIPTDIDSTTGLIRVRLLPGIHKIQVRWSILPQQWVGIGVSAAALLLWLLCTWRKDLRRATKLSRFGNLSRKDAAACPDCT